jgi:hypothetical protein
MRISSPYGASITTVPNVAPHHSLRNIPGGLPYPVLLGMSRLKDGNVRQIVAMA